MTFAHPALAWTALGAVALPIVIHLLFRRRRVPLEWAAMDLLREAVRRTNRRTKFEQWILLVLRALAVLAAGLAIAVPMASDELGLQDRRTTWMVVVDNGATSQLVTDGESSQSQQASRELDRLLDEVRVALRARGERDRVGVMTAAARPTVVLQPTADMVEVERVLSRVTASMTPSDLEGALRLARETLSASEFDTEGNEAASTRELRKIFIASGFRRGALREGQVFGQTSISVDDTTQKATQDDGPFLQDSIEILATVPASDVPTDVRIRSLEARMLPSGDALAVRVVLAREGSDVRAEESKVGAFADGFASSTQRVVRWDAGQTEATVEFQLTQESATARTSQAAISNRQDQRRAVRVELSEDRLRPGNNAYTIVDVRPEIEVGVVGRRGSLDTADLEKIPASLWIARALSPMVGGGIRVREIDPSTLDSRALLGLDAVILARPDLLATTSMETLGDFARAGGVVVVLPSGESLTQSWSAELFPRLGVGLRFTGDVKVLETPLRLADEQPRTPLLSTVRPELDALSSPVEANRLVECTGFTTGEVVLLYANGLPLVVAQSPRLDQQNAVVDVTATSKTRASGADSEASTPNTPTFKASTPLDQTQRADSRAGLIVVLTSAPELSWTNLPVKPLMVPLLQEIVRAGLQLAASRDEVAVGAVIQAEPSTTLQVVTSPIAEPPSGTAFRDPSSQSTSEATLSIGPDGAALDVVPVAGVWRSENQLVLASNVREDSIALTPIAAEELRAAFAPVGGMTWTASSENSKEDPARMTAKAWSLWSWPLFVIALLALLTEGVLAKIFSHMSFHRAGVSESTVSRGTGLRGTGAILDRVRATRGGAS